MSDERSPTAERVLLESRNAQQLEWYVGVENLLLRKAPSSCSREVAQRVLPMTLSRSLCALSLSVALGAALSAQTVTTIRFDDIAAFSKPLEQYSALGIHFSEAGYGVVKGMSNGDTGNWQLDGTDGFNFLGFSQYYSPSGLAQTITLDLPATNVSLDVSKAFSNSYSSFTFTLDAYATGHVLVGSQTVTLPTVNSWMTLSVAAAAITEINFYSSQLYGVDRLQFTQTTAVPEPSAYAGWAGLMALGFVLVRRRQKR